MDRLNSIIWWTNQDDTETVEEMQTNFPDYLQTEFRSRIGRNGRGRLWVPYQYMSQDWKIEWLDGPLFSKLEKSYGGIVMLAADINHVMNLPGIITDFNMRVIKAAPGAMA